MVRLRVGTRPVVGRGPSLKEQTVVKAKNSGSKCPVSKEDFREHAKPVAVTVGGSALAAMPKEFSTGSFGWYVNGKVVINVGGVPVPVQVGVNLTVVGSKPRKGAE